MKVVKRILWEIFDFFVGDWWILTGVAVSALLAFGISHWGFLAFLKPVSLVVYLVLLAATLVLVLAKETKRSAKE